MMAEGGRGAFSDDRQVGNGGTSNTVEVRGFSANINKELLEMYFENSRRSGGGDTEEVQIGDGVAYITFMEAEVAERVVSRSNHQVDGQTLTVALFHPSPPKPCYKNRVLIQGLNNAITEELLTNFLETVTEAKVREFLYGEDEGKVVVTLSDNIDIAQLRKIFRERSIERAFLQVTRVDISNCIIVQNLQPSTSHDVVLYYFENKRRSGGGDVERVEMKTDEGCCLVYFEDPSVIDRVLSQSHKVDGADVQVHLHHECLGLKPSRNRFDPYLRISSPGQTDIAVLEEENIDNKAKDKTSSSVSSNPEKESDFVEVPEWQENDGKNCTLTLWIKYKRAPDMKIIKCMKNIPCSWNFHLYWNFYTKAKQGQQMLHEIISKYNCSVAVCSDEEDLFIFEISAESFEQESDVVHYIHDVLDNFYKSAQQFLYSDIILVEQRMQGDVLQLMKQRTELDRARIELMGQQDNDAMCVVCTEKDKMSVLHVVTEIIHNVRECFENHEETISVDHNWQKVMKTFGYFQKLCDKFPKVTIILDETKPAIISKGPRDQSKAAADHLMELVGTAQSEVKEDIFSPGCQFDIFTYPEMCDYIDSIIMELSVVWIPNQLTKKIHLFSKKIDKLKSIDKTIKGCVQERVYPLSRDQSVHSPEMFNSFEKLKKMHTGKIVINPSFIGLHVTTADDIFESVDAAVQEIISKQTESESGTDSTGIENPTSAEEKDRYLEPMTELQKSGTERRKKHLYQGDRDGSDLHKDTALTNKRNEEKEVQPHENSHKDKEKIDTLVPAKDYDTLDNQLATSVKSDALDGRRKEKEVKSPKCTAEGDVASPFEYNVSFGSQRVKATYHKKARRMGKFGNEQQPEGDKDEDGMNRVTAFEDYKVNGTNTKGKGQRPRKTKDEDKVTEASNSSSPDNIDAKNAAASKSPEDDVTEESDDDYAIHVCVVKDQMTKRKEDVLVNSVHRSLNLSFGKVSQSILDAAGEDLQKECKKKYPNGIEPGQVAITRAYKLRGNKFIFHGTFDMWNSQNEEALKSTLMEFVTGCLQKADQNNMKTIAFPAIGTGNLNYPHKVVADCMFGAVEKYSQTTRQTNIDGVCFVAHFKDSAIVTAFEERWRVHERMITGSSIDPVSYPPSRGAMIQKKAASLHLLPIEQHSLPMCLEDTDIKQKPEAIDKSVIRKLGYVGSESKQGISLETSYEQEHERSKGSLQASKMGHHDDNSSSDSCQAEQKKQGKNQETVVKDADIRRASDEMTIFQETGVSSKLSLMSAEGSSSDNTRLSFTTAEGIKIFVYKCSILKASVDVIVSVANEDLTHTSEVAKVIADAAGTEFTEECTIYIRENGHLNVGSSCITTGGNLKYAFIIHTFGPQWDKYSKTSEGVQNCMDDLWRAVIGCFFKAETLQVQSVALPAVSSGIYGVPMEICASQYLSAVLRYSKSTQGKGSLKEIHFIDINEKILDLIALVFSATLENNEAAAEEFDERLQRVLLRFGYLSTQQTLKPILSLKKTGHSSDKLKPHYVLEKHKSKFHFSEVFKVLIYTGDITDSTCQAVVSSEDKDLKSEVDVAKAIRTKAGHKFYRNLASNRGRLRQVGDVIEIDAGNLKCKTVICCIIPKWTSSMSDEEYKRHLGQCFRNILEKAKAYKSVAIPLIETGVKNSNTEIYGRVLLESLLRFSSALGQKESLIEVHIVSLDDGPVVCVTSIFTEYFDSQKRLDSERTKPVYKGVSSTTSSRGQGQPSQNSSLQSKKARQGSKSGEHNKARVEADIDITENLASSNTGSNQPPESQKINRGYDKEDTCAFCLETFDDPVKMKKCGHLFCKGCIEILLQYKPVCPACGTIHGIITGNQPKGTMTESLYKYAYLKGYEGCGMIEITYNMPNGVQGDEHPKPGQHYYGLYRKAYLPNNEKGQKVLNLLHLAFDRRLIFTIGQSVTSGKDDMVTWNDIHHKTSKFGGPQKYGYPDPTYLDRVLEELAAKGVTEESERQGPETFSAYERVPQESRV